MQPIFAAIISVVFAGEKITVVKVLATILIFTGVYLVNFGFKKKSSDLEEEVMPE